MCPPFSLFYVFVCVRDELCQAAFMFNFAEENVLTLGARRLQVSTQHSTWGDGETEDICVDKKIGGV